MAVREEATPVPERAWALRNVASTLALGGPGERARARSLLEKAVILKEQWLNDDQHPGDQDSPGHRQCSISQKYRDAISTWFSSNNMDSMSLWKALAPVVRTASECALLSMS